MLARFRSLAALLALLAFSASFAETVWAQPCAAFMAGHATAGAVHHPAGHAVGLTPGTGAPPRSAPAPAPECPFSALSTTGCALVALPASAATVEPGSVVSLPVDAPPASPHVLLLVSPHFHPPQR